MKKSIFFAALMMTVAIFTSCNSGDATPQNDSTKLWSAQDAKGEKWGFIDAKGNMAISAMYDDVNSFSCGYAYARVGSNVFFIDKNGKNAATPDLSDGCDPYFYNNALCYKVNGNWGMLDNNFKTIIQPAYSFLGYMGANGLVAYSMSGDNHYGFLNKKGEVAISAIYDDAQRFSDGIAVVRVGDKWGAIDAKGQFAINAMYDRLESAGEGRVIFLQNEKFGLLDTKGNIVVNAMYDNIEACADNGLFPVRQGEKMGYINKSGDMKIAAMFMDGSAFYEGYAWVKRTQESNYELIDANGKTVLTLGKDENYHSMFHNGLALVYSYSDKGITLKYIDIKGTMIYSWTVGGYYAPAAERKVPTNAELFAGTQYAPLFIKK